MTLREIREAAGEFGAVSNRAELKRAVPFLVAGQERVKIMRETLKSVGEALEKLGEKCAKYALEYPSCFDEGLHETPAGAQCGDITIGGTAYHFTAGFGAPARIDGECLTQEFLSGLPKGWAKAKLELDAGGMNRLRATPEDLESHGLVRPAKNKWSAKRAEGVEAFDE